MKWTSGTHPSHLPAGPARSLYEYLWHERYTCDRGTVMWNRLTKHMDTVLSLIPPPSTQAKPR